MLSICAFIPFPSSSFALVCGGIYWQQHRPRVVPSLSSLPFFFGPRCSSWGHSTPLKTLFLSCLTITGGHVTRFWSVKKCKGLCDFWGPPFKRTERDPLSSFIPSVSFLEGHVMAESRVTIRLSDLYAHDLLYIISHSTDCLNIMKISYSLYSCCHSSVGKVRVFCGQRVVCFVSLAPKRPQDT